MRLANLALLLEKQRSELPHQLLRARELLGCCKICLPFVLSLLMNPVQSLREKRHAMKYFHDAMSKLEPAGQVDFLKTFTSIKENGNLDADNLLLLQRFILTLKGNPVLSIALLKADSIRTISTSRASQRCIVSSF